MSVQGLSGDAEESHVLSDSDDLPVVVVTEQDYNDDADMNDIHSITGLVYNNDLYHSSDSDDDETPLRFQDGTTLLSKLLDLDKPELNDKMVDFLVEEGVTELLMDYVVRPNAAAQQNMPPREGREPRVRNLDDVVAMKRSYNTMEMLSGSSRAINRFLSSKFSTILLRLFGVFEWYSDGNFHHFRRLFETVLRVRPADVMDLVTSRKNSEGVTLVFSMLDYLDESAVAASLGTLLFFPVKLSTDRDRRKQMYKYLNHHKFVKAIVQRMSVKDSSAALSAADFLMRLIDECTRMESSEIIVSNIHNDGDSFVDWIFEILQSQSPDIGNNQRTGCVRVLQTLLAKSGPKEYEMAVSTSNFFTSTQKMPNGLASTHVIVKAQLLNRLDILCKMALNTKPSGTESIPLPSHEVKAGFPSVRLSVLELMYDMLRDLGEIHIALDRIPANLWKKMADWFLEYRFNNVYHAVFYKLFVTALRANHEPTLRALLSGSKFLTRMIEHHTSDETSGCRGYILLLCNMLRLTADAQSQSDYIPSMLQSHHRWNEFLSRLRNDTLQQVAGPDVPSSDPSFQRPMPHVGPLMTAPETDESVRTMLSSFLKPGDIDLGSQYAYALGFMSGPRDDDDDDEMSEGEAEKKKKRKKNKKKKGKKNNHSSTNNSHSSSEASSVADDEEESPEVNDTMVTSP